MARGNGRNKRRRRNSGSSQPTNPPASSVHSSDEDVPSTSTSAAAAAVELSKREAKIQEFNLRYDVANKTKEQVLAAQMNNWSSTVYDHFVMPPSIIVVKGDVRYKFVCAEHKGPSPPALTRARWEDSTSNLIRHVDICTPSIPPAGQAINDFAHGSTYTKASFRFLLSLWIARRHRPFKIVHDAELIQLFRMLHSKVEIPSAQTVSRDIREIFSLSREYVAKQLQDFPGRLHLGIDGWTSPNVLSFLGITVHYVVDAEMRTFILDFVKLSQNHTGKYLAEELAACLKAYGIEKKILGITGDNATNNDTLVAELELLLPNWYSMLARIRCLAHILNLIVKAILSLFAAQRRAASSDGSEDEDTELMALEDDGDDTEMFAVATQR
ncbi:hypothetical protein EUX98_g9461 [Antrodiella citrinella]|uniref:DUF659 domain-containing protein n=1 Tax=Antrodiella citrinella TaxID=2447956 RepID=A0A4S4LSR7_9APHY|nr:hypothetical protein EUX98_g9461 [Antrodiella citrinella]